VSDRLDRAFRALRETEDGHEPRAEETLARILRQVDREPLRKSLPARRVWLLAAAVLAVSTAAAARSGQLERVFRAFAWTGAGDSAPAISTTHAAGPAAPPSPASSIEREISPPPAVPGTAPIEGAPSGPRAQAAASESAEATGLAHHPQEPVRAKREPIAPAASAPAGRLRKTSPASRSPSESAAAPSASAAASAKNPDDEAFARAHALHFHGADPAAALSAWDEYLRGFPAGRFAPEARYNRAIDLLKLGRTAEARDALQPFAEGALGDYRRDEARAILRSLESGGNGVR
jgi:hypothetical protein